MPQNRELDSAALESQVSVKFHNPLQDLAQTKAQAPASNNRASTTGFVPWDGNLLDGAAVADGPAQASIIASAEQARRKLAVEALMADPAEMRRMYDDVRSKVPLNDSGNIESWGIQEGLTNNSLSEKERDFLVILRDDYSQLKLDLSYTGTPTVDCGVSPDSMAIIDKALNRKLDQDPIYKKNAGYDLTTMGPLVGLAGGGFIGVLAGKNIEVAAISSVVLGVLATAGLEAKDYMRKKNGSEDLQYDAIAKQYKAFEEKETQLPSISSGEDAGDAALH